MIEVVPPYQCCRRQKRSTQPQFPPQKPRLDLAKVVYLRSSGAKKSRQTPKMVAKASDAPKLVYVRCEGERGSGPKGANDLCWAKI